ncbi:MAG: hypothetical protein ACYSWQ_03140 [Planctomycetota bacterium]|jgi:hypothetical protein
MSNRKLGRREFLRLAVSRPVSVPILFMIGCDSPRQKAAVRAPESSPEESLKKLILTVGPWTAQEKEEADDFARRFLAAEHAVAPYLPESSKVVRSLAGRFPDGIMAAEEIDLRELPGKERRLLVNLTTHLYSFVEIRFMICKQPPQGECQSGGLPYTSAPL